MAIIVNAVEHRCEEGLRAYVIKKFLEVHVEEFDSTVVVMFAVFVLWLASILRVPKRAPFEAVEFSLIHFLHLVSSESTLLPVFFLS